MNLDFRSLRVLGALMEKEMTTPENYPLSLNALIAACNQRSSREPVLELTEDEVRQSLHILEDLALVTPTRDARVPKYEHRIRTVLNLRRDETGVLCLLLLRGPQTPGELRSRSDRMHSFDDLASVVATLERLASRPVPQQPEGRFGEGPLTLLLARQPGSREARYAHLLGDPAALPVRSQAREEADRASESTGFSAPSNAASLHEELTSLRVQVAELEERVRALEAREQAAPEGHESS